MRAKFVGTIDLEIDGIDIVALSLFYLVPVLGLLGVLLGAFSWGESYSLLSLVVGGLLLVFGVCNAVVITRDVLDWKRID